MITASNFKIMPPIRSENTITQTQQQVDFALGNRKKEKIDTKLGVKLDLNQSRFRDNSSLNQQYQQPTWYHELSWDMSTRINVSYVFSYTQYRG